MSTIRVSTLDAFVQEVEARGLKGAVMRETREVRARFPGDDAVVVGHVHLLTLLAYDKGLMLRCQLPGEHLGEAVERLSALGITLRQVMDNIG